MQKAIVHEFFFHHPAADVWSYLTEPDLIEQWLMPNDFKAEVGHQFMFKTKPIEIFGFDGMIYCQVQEIIPMQKLVYSWKGGSPNKKPLLDTVVTWTLTEKDRGTMLKLKHSGFSGMKNYFPYLVMNKGWLKIGKKLIAGLDNPTQIQYS